MTTATATTVGPLHAAVAAAAVEVQRLDRELQGARAKVAGLTARDKELSGTLREARVEVSIGRQPSRSVANLKGDLAALGEDFENAQAKVTALERLTAEAAAHLAAARQELLRAEIGWFTERAAQVTGQMREAAVALQQTQHKCIALQRALQRQPLVYQQTTNLIEKHLLFAEIVDTYGGSRVWPFMGDRKTGDDLLVSDLRETEQALEAL